MLRLRVRPSVSVTQQTAETETAQNADTDHSERGMVAVHGILQRLWFTRIRDLRAKTIQSPLEIAKYTLTMRNLRSSTNIRLYF